MALPAYSRFGLHTAWPFNILFSILHNKLKLFTTMKKFYMILAAFAAMAMTVQAQDVLQGTLQVGDFDNPTETYNGSYFDVAPTNFYLAHTGAQMLYTPAELADLQDKANVNVTKLSFKFYNESAYDDITRDIKVSVQAIDETQFAVNDQNKKMFFEFGEPVLDYEVTYSMLDLLYEDNEIVFDFANAPIELPAGKTLLVTAIFDAQDDANCTGSTDEAPFYTSGTGKAMVYTHNTVGFEEFAGTDDFPVVTSGTGTNVNLPVTKVDYTYTDQATAIDDVKAAATTDGAYYNLMGQKFNENSLPAGIYIDNGKKVIVK